MGRNASRGFIAAATVITGLSSAVVMAAPAAPAAAAPAAGHTSTAVKNYVALGDSYAAGGDLTQLSGPLACARSATNYSTALAGHLKPAQFTDVTCSGATTEEVRLGQKVRFEVHLPSQYDAVRPDTDLVTITVGGNDVDASPRSCNAASWH